MARSLLERLKNTIRDNLVDFLEVEPQSEAPSLENMSSSEIVRRLKLRLGTVEAERYRLAQVLAEEAAPDDLNQRASAALDAGDERLAREILRLKVDHASTLSEADEKREDLDLEAEDLQALIALIEANSEIDESLEQRLETYEAALQAPTDSGKKG